MVSPEITSDSILSIISGSWLTNDDIANELGLKHSLDKGALDFRLNDLNVEGKVVSVDYNGRIYWKCSNSESTLELRISFCLALLDKDPFDAWLWYKLGNQYLEYGGYDMEELDIHFFVTDVFTQSKKCYQNALAVVDPEIDHKLYFDILLNLVLIYVMLGEPDKAQSKIDSLLEIKEEFEVEYIGQMYKKLAQVYLYKADYTQALEYATESHIRLMDDEALEIIFHKIEIGKERNKEDSTTEDLELEMDTNPPDHQKINDTNPGFVLQEMLQEMRKLTQSSEKGLIISMKSYIDQSIKPFLDKPSKKKFKILKKAINNYKEGWPDDMWESFVEEFHRTLDIYKELQPSKWQKWGNVLLKLIPIFH